MHPKGGTSQRGEYDAYLDADASRSIWLYTSCMASGCAPPIWDGNPLWTGWPSYHIDQRPVEQRAMPWQAYLYEASGEYYFETMMDLADAWNVCNASADNCQFNEGGNGDGTFFYPGTPGQIGGPAGSDIPIESIRLKRIRDGREDFEYLHYLSTHGKGVDARAVAGSLFSTMSDSDLDADQFAAQQTFLAARGELIDLLTPAGGATCAGQAVTVPGATAGDDTLTGTAGNDVIAGLGGNDTINGLAGTDILCGDAGNDLIRPGLGDDGQVDGGADTDTISYSDATTAMNINLTNNDAFVPGGGAGSPYDTFTNFENAVASPLGGSVFGSPGPNVLTGLAGPDVLHGFAGNDTLVGGLGVDEFHGGDNDDQIQAQDGVGAESIGCGLGADSVTRDPTDVVDPDCETVTTNTAPTISDIADQTTPVNTAEGPLAFTVGDAETAAGSLTVTGSSSNTTLVPNANITFGGAGANRTVTVTPAAGPDRHRDHHGDRVRWQPDRRGHVRPDGHASRRRDLRRPGGDRARRDRRRRHPDRDRWQRRHRRTRGQRHHQRPRWHRHPVW